MKDIISSVIELIGVDNLQIITLLLLIYFVLLSLYNDIRYRCLQKAVEFVSEIEENNNLSGIEKFNTVVTWIREELPFIFSREWMVKIIRAFVQYSYINSKSFTDNYIKRKTGMDIDKLLNEIKKASNSVSDSTENGLNRNN